MQDDRKLPEKLLRTGRRAMLGYSAAGGLAVASGLLGVLTSATDTEAGQIAGKMMLPNGKMRRIVTALNAEGKSYIASDGPVDANDLWKGTPDRPLGVAGENEPPGVTHATGQSRCFVAAIQPSKDPKPTMSNRLGYHRGNGVSHCLILDGDLVFMVDTQETIVRPGDLIVERNTLHSWRNEGTQPVSMFIVTINAE
jgi:mannose-6-phosphate isomerase-like protein (cupin superfamily)